IEDTLGLFSFVTPTLKPIRVNTFMFNNVMTKSFSELVYNSIQIHPDVKPLHQSSFPVDKGSYDDLHKLHVAIRSPNTKVETFSCLHVRWGYDIPYIRLSSCLPHEDRLDFYSIYGERPTRFWTCKPYTY